ncbi:unnamed protein product [marine sediment metagenome]|uniref:Uncharacterized protein n=1 Tax=marine sediment metagenome TaxID=412755 RepID=X1KZC5_9ZZZZ
MLPPKAREILQLNIDEASKKMPPDVKVALTMGAGAIERIIEWRETCNDDLLWKLPGETEE